MNQPGGGLHRAAPSVRVRESDHYVHVDDIGSSLRP